MSGQEVEESITRGDLLKRGLGHAPVEDGELPWEGGFSWEESAQSEEKEKEKGRLERRLTLRAGFSLAIFPVILVLMEEVLFPALSRPLALFPQQTVLLEKGPLVLPMLALMMGGSVLLEGLFMTLLVGTIAELFEQPVDFRQIRGLYPRIQAPRILVAWGLILLGTTGIIQPLFPIWWLVGGVWGGILLWLAGREIYNWHDVGNILLLVGYTLFQGLVMLGYYLFH